MSKTAVGLAAWARGKLNGAYWYGTYGRLCTQSLLDAKARQYPAHYTANRMPRYKRDIAEKKRAFDCVGLIKAYLWSDPPGGTPKYNAAQDVSANMMRARSGVKPIGSIPDEPGLLVFFDGHVGVYIGGGQVVEARGSDYGVVKTALKSRPWTSWGRCPWVSYSDTPAQDPSEYITHTMKKGDTLWALASRHLGGGTRWPELARLNDIKDEKKIPIGKVIKIPKGGAAN